MEVCCGRVCVPKVCSILPYFLLNWFSNLNTFLEQIHRPVWILGIERSYIKKAVNLSSFHITLLWGIPMWCGEHKLVINTCFQEYGEVCGSDSQTYQSECQLRTKACSEQTHLDVLYKGDCGKAFVAHVMCFAQHATITRSISMSRPLSLVLSRSSLFIWKWTN